MTVNIMYFLATITSLCGLIAVWEFGLQSFFLDAYRARLFEIRDYLFNLGASGRISFNDPAYRSTELLLNGLIQYAHRMSFLSLIVSRLRGEGGDEHEYIKFRNHMNSLVDKAPIGAQEELRKLQFAVSQAVAVYLGASSLLCKVGLVTLAVLEIFHPESVRSRKERAVCAIEHHAYQAAKRGFRPSPYNQHRLAVG